jgi:signal transduction histidine kinase/FixJ family two-component response regulator
LKGFISEMIKNVIERLVELGTQPQKGPKHNQITRLVNKICFLVILVITPHMLLTLYYKSTLATLMQLVTVMALCLTVFLNSRRYLNVTRILTLLIGNFHIFIMVLILGLESGVYFYFAAAIIAPLFFYTLKESKYILFFGMLTTSLALLVQYLGGDFKPIVQTPDQLLTFFFYFSVAGSQLTVFGFVLHFYNESNRLEKHLIAANQAKSLFLANMSHELRTPLNAILGFSELMTRDQNLTLEQQRNLETIGRSGEHLLALINDVLELSKIEAGLIVLHEENFDLHRLLLGLEEMFRLRARQKRLSIEFEQADDVPRYIRADQNKLRQILINLLSNAVKFTEEGKITLRVNAIASSQEENNGRFGTLHFEVIDTGVGIVPEEQENVFDAFFQTSVQRHSQQGTGLGLTISQRFVSMMGGGLKLDSEVGRGTKISFEIPVEHVKDSDIVVDRPVKRVTGLEPGQQIFRILVVEDHEVSRDLLIKLLRQVGFETREAANGKEAVTVYEQWRPHLIWMDMRMPVMDGFESTRQIKTSPDSKDTVIIALTASAFEEDRKRVLEHGCNDFVRKPFREREIFEMLTKHLGVAFVYEEDKAEGRGPKAESHIDSMKEAVIALPVALHQDFRKAVESIDFDKAIAIVEQIRERDKELATDVAELLNSYRFDTLQKLFKENE